MHAAHAGLVVHVQAVVVVQAQGLGRAHADDLIDEFLAAQLLDLGFHLGLVDLHIVLPGAQHGHVGALGGVGAVIGAAGELELHLIRQGGAMDVVGEVVDHRAMGAQRVIASLLAAGLTDAACCGTHTGTGAAHVEAHLVQLVPGGLDLIGAAALEHDVARLAMQGDQARAMLFPDVAHLAQRLGVVEEARRRHDADGMEFRGFRELARHFGEARNDARAIAEHADRAALPIALAGLIAVFQLAQQAFHDGGMGLAIHLRQTLQSADKAWPGAGFQLVQHGRGGHLLRHDSWLPNRRYTAARGTKAGAVVCQILQQSVGSVLPGFRPCCRTVILLRPITLRDHNIMKDHDPSGFFRKVA